MNAGDQNPSFVEFPTEMGRADVGELHRLREDNERKSDACNAMNAELGKTRANLIQSARSRRFMKNILEGIAAELGLAKEDISGITSSIQRLVHGGATGEAYEEAVALGLQRGRESLRDWIAHVVPSQRATIEGHTRSHEALKKQLHRIGKRAGQKQHETVEHAVDRVCEALEGQTPAPAQAVAVETLEAEIRAFKGNNERIRKKLRAREGETALAAVDRICTMFEPPEPE